MLDPDPVQPLGGNAGRASGRPPAPVPVVVISLVRSADRRAAIGASLGQLHVPFRFLDACDGLTLDAAVADVVAARRNRSRLLRRLSRGEIACALSHLDAATLAARAEAPFTCVLEDDAVVEETLLPFLDADALAALPAFDVLRLHREKRFSRVFAPIGEIGGRAIVAPFMPGFLGHAQIYSRIGAAKVAAHALPLGAPIDGVIYRDAMIPALRIVEARPGLVRARGRTTIEDRAKPPVSAAHFFRRKLYLLGRYLRSIRRFFVAWGFRGLRSLRITRS
jgi:glycosyl transferase family 25